MKKPLKETYERMLGTLNEAKAQHGFDLTDFKRNGFKQLLKALKIKPKAEHSDRSGGSWEWKGNGILIITANNPITGEYAVEGRRKNEKDYASLWE